MKNKNEPESRELSMPKPTKLSREKLCIEFDSEIGKISLQIYTTKKVRQKLKPCFDEKKGALESESTEILECFQLDGKPSFSNYFNYSWHPNSSTGAAIYFGPILHPVQPY